MMLLSWRNCSLRNSNTCCQHHCQKHHDAFSAIDHLADAWCLASWLLGLLHGDDAACFPISTSFPLPVPSSFLAHCTCCPSPSTPQLLSTVTINCHYLVDHWPSLFHWPSLSHWPSTITIAIPNLCHIRHYQLIVSLLLFYILGACCLFSCFFHHCSFIIVMTCCCCFCCCAAPCHSMTKWTMSTILSVRAIQWVCVGYCILQKWMWFPPPLLWYSWVWLDTLKWFATVRICRIKILQWILGLP